MSIKQDLPNSNAGGSANLTSEWNQYNYLFTIYPRSSSGDISFTSTSSGIIYTTSGSIYANQGQNGMLAILQSALANYLVSATDFNNKLDNNNYTQTVPYAVTTGVANTYTITLSPAPTSYIDGMAIAIKINIASTGASTINVNGLGAISIKDSLGNAITSGGLKANIIYSLRYEVVSGNFIVQGKNGGGNATTSDLRQGKTATTDIGQITGNLIDNGSAIITPSNIDQTLNGIYTNGKVSKVTFDTSKVLNDTTIAGTTGIMLENGDQSAIITTQGGTKVLPNGHITGGTITVALPDNGSQSATLTTNGATKVIPVGYTGLGGTITVSIPNKSAQTYTPATTNQIISAGQYLSGDQIIQGDLDYIASNILNTANLWGLQGVAINGAGMRNFASGTITSDLSGVISVGGLSFTPYVIGLISGNKGYYFYPPYSTNTFMGYGVSSAGGSVSGGSFVCNSAYGNYVWSWQAWS